MLLIYVYNGLVLTSSWLYFDSSSVEGGLEVRSETPALGGPLEAISGILMSV